jgi:hypothetical protein
MPKHIGSIQVEGDSLRLMQSMLSPLCILMGSAKTADPGDSTQGVLEAGLERQVSLAGSGRSCVLLLVCRS